MHTLFFSWIYHLIALWSWVLEAECLYPLRMHVLKLNPQGDGIQRWSLWEVILIAVWNEPPPPQRAPTPLLPCKDTAERWPVYELGSRTSPNLLAFWSWTFFFFFFFLSFFRAVPMAYGSSQTYGSSQVRGQIRTVADGLHLSLSNVWSKLHLWHTTAHSNTGSLNPLSKARDWTRVIMDTSQVHYCWAITRSPDLGLHSL